MNFIGPTMCVGRLITGKELIIVEIRKQKAKLVFVATGTSENTRKKVKDKSSYYEVPRLELFSEAEITRTIGKPRRILGMMDTGFAKKTRELIEGQEGDCMGNKRTCELAKKLKKSNKDVVEGTQQLGIDMKNHTGATTSSDEKKLQ